MFFDDWSGLGRVVVVGTMAYAALVVFLRVSGNRTLSKLNAFDLVVTVALGSTLATVLLSESVALAEGLLVLALLISLQYAITWLSVRHPWVQEHVKSEPRLVLRDGRFLEGSMKAQRITQEKILAALRTQGVADPAEVAAVVLETDGSLSVLKSQLSRGNGTLDAVVLGTRNE